MLHLKHDLEVGKYTKSFKLLNVTVINQNMVEQYYFDLYLINDNILMHCMNITKQ